LSQLYFYRCLCYSGSIYRRRQLPTASHWRYTDMFCYT